MSERKQQSGKKMPLNPNADMFNISNGIPAKENKDPIDPEEIMKSAMEMPTSSVTTAAAIPKLAMYAVNDDVAVENIGNGAGGKKMKRMDDDVILKNAMFAPVAPPPLSAPLSTSFSQLNSLPTTLSRYRANEAIAAGAIAAGNARVAAAAAKMKKGQLLKSVMFGLPPPPTNKRTATATVVKKIDPSGAKTSDYDDDINDGAPMAGIDVDEESNRMLENVNDDPLKRSCGEEESFLNMTALQARLRRRMLECGLGEPSPDAVKLISDACKERIKTTVEQLVVAAEHRTDSLKNDPRYEVSRDIRGQLKFLAGVERAQEKRKEKIDAETLLRKAKPKSRTEYSDQAKLKAKAKEIQRAEVDEIRLRQANSTALRAIGPRKKLEMKTSATIASIVDPTGNSKRTKHVTMRDMIAVLEQDPQYCRSELLMRAHLK